MMIGGAQTPVALLAGSLMLQACANDLTDDAGQTAVHRSIGPYRMGDDPVYEGMLSRSDEVFEFRACNMEERYLVDASYSIIDTLDQAVHTGRTGGTALVYVRFHAEVIADVDNLPDRYTDVIRITELLVYDQPASVDCK